MERRQHQRIPLVFPIRVRIEDIEKFTEQFAADLSAGGIFLPMQSPLAVDTRVNLEFYLEAVKKLIRTKGRVVHSRIDGQPGEGPAGMGIEFVDLRREAKRFIELMVQKYNRQHPNDVIEMSFDASEERVTPATAEGEPTASDLGPQDDSPAAELFEVSPEVLAALEEPGPPPKVDLQVRIRYPGEDSFMAEAAHTLQGDEIFVRSDRMRETGAPVHLMLFVTEEGKWAPATGEIAGAMYSSGTAATPAGPGFAIEILNPSNEIGRLLHSSPQRT